MANTITLQINELLKPEGPGDKFLARLRLSEHFFARLVALIERRFCLRGAAGAEDVANSVLRIAFGHIEEGHYREFACRDNLWALLTTNAVRRAMRQRRDDKRMRRNGGDMLPADRLENVADPVPDPAQLAEIQEQCQRLFDLLDDDLRGIAHLMVDEELTFDKAQHSDHQQASDVVPTKRLHRD